MKIVPFKKGAVLSCLGFASLASLGIYSILSQSTQTLNSLPVPVSEAVDSSDQTEASTNLMNGSTIAVKPEAKDNNSISSEQRTKLLSEHDAKYLAGVSSYSMARKYKDYLVLAPRDSVIGKEKAEKMAKLAEESKDKRLYTYWDGYRDANYLRQRPALIADGCRKAVSYSELTTAFTIPTSKTYWNLLWNICGKDDKSKPYSWGWS